MAEMSSNIAIRTKASETYAEQSREATQERLILDHLPLVRHIVHRVASHLSRKPDVEDMISAGTLGLVRAARGFDPSRNVEFKTYAYIRVRGAVIDELRGRSFVPSAIHSQIRHIRRAYQSCVADKGAPPDDPQLAAAAGISLEQMYRTLEEARKQHFMSIHGLSDEDPALGNLAPQDPAPGPGAAVEHKEMLEKLSQAIGQLPKRDRVLILLYYDRDLTMKEAAAVLGVTESRVSQLHASALFKLSMKLKAIS